MSSYNQIYTEQINKICIVFNKQASGSGLLFWYDTRLYLLTVKHILSAISNPIMYTITNVNIWNKDKYKYEQFSQVLGFICIGFDTTSDIAVCVYNSTLNINNNIEYLSTDKLYNKNYIEAFEFSDFIDSRQLSIGDKICIIGQSKGDNNTMSAGIIKDNVYNGFPENTEMVESILCDIASYKGSSGSPIINLNNKICGMVIGGFDEYLDHLTVGVSSKIIRVVIPKFIKKYMDFSSKDNISDISRILLSTTLQKCYLGLEYNQINYDFFIKNNELQNKLKNVGGILVYNFIVGINTLDNTLIYNYETINSSTINIHNPFQYNVITIQLTNNSTINQIISTHKTPFRDLQIINNFVGLNENSIINSGAYINVFNSLKINTSLWQLYYDKIHKSFPLIFTKIWFTKDYYVNNINIGQWVDLNIGKYRGQIPLSDYIYECSRDIINDPIKNIPVYRFNSNNMANVQDKSNTKIENMVDINKDILTIGDIIIEFYYNISQSVDLSNNKGSWQGPVYQKIKPYIIYNNISNGQNNTNSYVLSIEQPDILNSMESTLQIDTFDGFNLIEERNITTKNDRLIRVIRLTLLGESINIGTKSASTEIGGKSNGDVLDEFNEYRKYFNSLNDKRKNKASILLDPIFEDALNTVYKTGHKVIDQLLKNTHPWKAFVMDIDLYLSIFP
jgi:hypothetical protein